MRRTVCDLCPERKWTAIHRARYRGRSTLAGTESHARHVIRNLGAGDRGRNSRAGVACRRQLRQGSLEEPGLEEVVELLTTDLLGQGYEVLGGSVPIVKTLGPGPQNCEEHVVADTQTECVEGQRAAVVNDGRGEQVARPGVAGPRR